MIKVLLTILKFCSQFWCFFQFRKFHLFPIWSSAPTCNILIPILKFCYQFWSFVPNSNKKLCFIDVHFAKRAVWKSGTNEVTWEGEGRGAGQAWEDLPLLFSVYHVTPFYQRDLSSKSICTVCPKSSHPFYIVSYYIIKWGTTSWTYSIVNKAY